MDLGDGFQEDDLESPSYETSRPLPKDLPRTLDDRKAFSDFPRETEFYDAWQGQSQFLQAPAQPLNFDLSLDHLSGDGEDFSRRMEDSDSRLMEMLAAQAAHKEDGSAADDVEKVVNDEKLSDADKRKMLQSSLNMAASNGDVNIVKRLVSGKAKDFVDVNAPDEEGTAPLIYASCFGHQEVVQTLLNAGADVDKQDRNQWSALMWALTNRHKNIAKIMLDHGASPEVKSSTGRTAYDFIAPNSEISEYLHDSGYHIGRAGVADDFYSSGLSQDRFEEEMAENELKRRMAMESAFNLEVDLGNLGLDEQPEELEYPEEGHEFVWDKCLNDQMFVFQENELGRILDMVITNMTPQRSPSQKPVPANILFLGARYGHYHANPELLETLLVSSMDKINDVVAHHQWDMTMLAFWISNVTLLLHYLKKDPGLMQVTTEFQLQLSELINEIFVLIIRDAERRMEKVLDQAMLDHETIPGFEDVTFQNEWKIFRSKTKVKPPEPIGKRFRPPSPRRRAQTSPRNITSLLSSTLFVLDLYDVHSVITSQALAQLFYWLGTELFNRIMSNRKYLARTKAMQIRMNMSTLEDWARANNRQPEHYENGAMTSTGETTVDAARRYLAPLVQLLQWLQCFSSLGQDFDALVATLQQLSRLTPQQLIHAVQYYRAEVGEKGLSKDMMKYLKGLDKEHQERRAKNRLAMKEAGRETPTIPRPSTPTTPHRPPPPESPMRSPSKPEFPNDEDDYAPEHLLLNSSIMLPFSLPTSTDMLITYGGGLGGLNRERARKYVPTVPPEFLQKLDATSGRNGSIYEDAKWDSETSA